MLNCMRGNMMVAFCLVLVVLVPILVHAQSSLVIVSCRENGNICRVEFDLSENKRHSVELIRETNSVFANGAVITTLSGDDAMHVVHRRLEGIRYHSRLDASSKLSATALISENHTELLDGIFSTESHGVIEWAKDYATPMHTRRRTQAVHQDFVLDLPEGKPWLNTGLEDRLGGPNIPLSSILESSSVTFGNYIPFFPGCYPGDVVTHVFKMNLVIDVGLYRDLSANVAGDEAAKRSKVLSTLESTWAFGKLLYLSQLNIRVEIQKIVIGTPSDPPPFSRGGSTGCISAPAAFYELVGWLSANNQNAPSGYWMLVSNCFISTGPFNGASYIGSACGNGNNGGAAVNAWNVIFHELGHAFGMSHSFENGLGKTGGLMDYGDTLWNGITQYHPNKRAEVCPYLTSLKAAGKCSFLTMSAPEDSCGDGVLTKSEGCECLVKGSKSCDKCVNCKLTDPNIECSSATFVVRNSLTADIVVVEPDSLSSPQCCLRNRFASPKTLCGNKLLDVCGKSGQCAQVCSVHLMEDNPICGFDDNGCLLGCSWKNRCRFDLTYSNQDGSEAFVSAVPDGAPCNLAGGGKGQCSNAKCAPTDSPRQEAPTTSGPDQIVVPNRTPKPTAEPTSQAETRIPTAAPTKTPTMDQESARCARSSNRKRCLNTKCQWCPGACMPRGSTCTSAAARRVG